MKYFEIFGEGGFHSAFMTTFAFGSLAFEDIPFPKLRGAGCRNITVLADQGMVNQAFSEYGSPRFAGTSYHLVKVAAPGAFHPKITMLIGETKGRLFVGSANLTALGLGGNKEQIASISYSNEEPENAKFFISALNYMRRYVSEDDLWFAKSLKLAQRYSPWLRDIYFDDSFDVNGTVNLNLLLDRQEISFLRQIVASIGSDPIERLVVVSPYWDRQLEGLDRLRTELRNPITDILIVPDSTGFPSNSLSKLSDTTLFDISSIAKNRFLHAKLIIAQGNQWDHIISGSMNCTFPALMGPAAYGNAEAGIYKRIAHGEALKALGLENYKDVRLQDNQLLEIQQTYEKIKTIEPRVDGGTLTLQNKKLYWAPPIATPEAPVILFLYNHNDILLNDYELNAPFVIDEDFPDDQRPKYGCVKFANGTISAPVNIVDIDKLVQTTSRVHIGRKGRFMDSLLESHNEDLDLIETLNQLEALDDDKWISNTDQAPKAKSQATNTVIVTYERLTYEEFIRARTNAKDQGNPFGLFLKSNNDSSSSLMSTCLNQMIGLVGPDFRREEDREIKTQGAIDFRMTELQSADDFQSAEKSEDDVPKTRESSTNNRATANKFRQAVTVFEERCKSLVDKQITTSEIVRLRALIQIILAHAQPIEGEFLSAQILPIYSKESYDWPRLIGRLLQKHFQVAIALQNLIVEEDESEQKRVLEYLAFSNWAAKAALTAVLSDKKSTALRGPLERLIEELKVQSQVILSQSISDQAYFDEILEKINDRFGMRLGVTKYVWSNSTLHNI